MKYSLSDNEKEAVLTLKRELRRRFKIYDFRLFGSRARGEAVPGSDIDIAIELEELTPKIEREIDEMVFRINLKFDCFISTVMFSRSELMEGPMDESPIYKNIVREGLRI